MEAEGLTNVLGLDADFVLEGFRLLPQNGARDSPLR
jgi:hypothetical protein